MENNIVYLEENDMKIFDLLSSIELNNDDSYTYHNPKASDEKAQKHITKAIDSFAPNISPEDVILLISDTMLGDTTKGIIFTKDTIYSNKTNPIKYTDIKKISNFLAQLSINGISMNTMTTRHNMIQLRKALNTITEDILSLKIDKSWFRKVEIKIDDFIERAKIAKATKIEKFVYLSLAPLYFFMVYYKTVAGADLGGLILVSFLVLILFVPVQALIEKEKLDYSVDNIFDNENIIMYLRTVLAFLVTYFIYSILASSNIFTGWMSIVIFIPVYIGWYIISVKLLALAKELKGAHELRIHGLLGFITFLFFISFFIALPSTQGFLNNLFNILDLYISMIVFVLFFLPAVGLKASSASTALIKNGFASITALLSLLNPAKLIAVYVVLIIVVNIIDAITQSINAYWMSFLVSVVMITVSALGSWFQINLFLSSYEKNAPTRKKTSLIFIGIFYGVMVLNMGLVSTIKDNSYKIRSAQKNVSSFTSQLNSIR